MGNSIKKAGKAVAHFGKKAVGSVVHLGKRVAHAGVSLGKKTLGGLHKVRTFVDGVAGKVGKIPFIGEALNEITSRAPILGDIRRGFDDLRKIDDLSQDGQRLANSFGKKGSNIGNYIDVYNRRGDIKDFGLRSKNTLGEIYNRQRFGRRF